MVRCQSQRDWKKLQWQGMWCAEDRRSHWLPALLWTPARACTRGVEVNICMYIFVVLHVHACVHCIHVMYIHNVPVVNVVYNVHVYVLSIHTYTHVQITWLLYMYVVHWICTCTSTNPQGSNLPFRTDSCIVVHTCTCTRQGTWKSGDKWGGEVGRKGWK